MTTAFFGELLLRLSPPGRELLFQRPSLDVHVGGAEANVAIGLASLGHSVRMLSVVPDHKIGETARGELRRHGVDVGHVEAAPGRLGLYFLTPGAGLRASEVIYDRAYSAFALRGAEDWDWERLLDGCDALHLSGITPALGPNTAAAALAAARAAKARGMRLSFDGNYRARLWEAWDSDPRGVLTELVGHADILFGNHRDVALLLGKPFSGDGPEHRREAALAAFDAFPNLGVIASTARDVIDADHHRLSARVETREAVCQTDEVSIAGIVDRIGAGDAFAAGVLHGLAQSGPDQAARDGLALTCLKHSLPGDASLFTARDLAAFHDEGLDVRR
ncbi:sugar kinase [Sphingomonas qomolangmaensis]|uniref:Sugar kinase n=1 Tax=Sphingomonas qomolangmaensis TaxID=2918765 RepID=A0ABY5L6C1_9SPHN|nr:sugar kinase [Sphingomonas qomolangmaensis]UUL81711.1 sugar kinase [Sphingomonas qomolangmaensis]